VEDWVEIRRLHRAEKMPIKVIARVLGCSKNTVKAALASEGPPKYSRRPVGSIVDVVEPRIRELLAACPTMPATVIAERIGWERSIRTFVGSGCAVASGVFAAGSFESHGVCGWGDRSA
jgi:transposase